MTAIYRFSNHTGSVRSTVVRRKDGRYQEVRRNDTTWTAAYRAQHPTDKPRVWDSLSDWHGTLPIVHQDVANWHRATGWKLPPAVEPNENGYYLSCHLSHFMRAPWATVSQLIAAFQSFEAEDSASSAWQFLTGGPAVWDESWTNLLPALMHQGHILEHVAVWPQVEKWHATNRSWRATITGERSLLLSPELRYFMGIEGWTADWSDIQEAFYSWHPEGREDGYFFIDCIQRSLFGITEAVLPQPGAPHKLMFSELRRVLMKNGHVQLLRAPEVVSFPEVDPFEEIDAVFFRVDEVITDPDVDDAYKGILVEHFLNFCMRPTFAELWKNHVFERIQMRASLEFWREETVVGDSGHAVGAILRFLDAYPA